MTFSSADIAELQTLAELEDALRYAPEAIIAAIAELHIRDGRQSWIDVTASGGTALVN